jgi:uncharacterized lipoprotein
MIKLLAVVSLALALSACGEKKDEHQNAAHDQAADAPVSADVHVAVDAPAADAPAESTTVDAQAQADAPVQQ